MREVRKSTRNFQPKTDNTEFDGLKLIPVCVESYQHRIKECLVKFRDKLNLPGYRSGSIMFTLEGS
jgi:pyoverdine/dityrosine biosynthesis protein Dit1